MDNCLYRLGRLGLRVHRGWGLFWGLYTKGVYSSGFSTQAYSHFHIIRWIGGRYSYRALMLALMSLMTSATSGFAFISFSTRSMECMTVV